MKVILEEYLQGIAAAGERIARCEEAMRVALGKMASGAGGARAHGDERFSNRGGHDPGERTGGSASLCPSAPGDGLSGVGADGEQFQ